ncbi:MAG: hypothetical protein HRT67_08530 [Flavobacteriaceae bacterium]|nr:hypothetical protein [Flavobacteriaceae bacterium]
MSKHVILDFAKITIQECFMIEEINKGVHLTPKHHKTLGKVCSKYFSSTPFIIISHRINSYSVDPIVHKKASENKNLMGFAVVASAPVARANAELEKLFLKKPFEIFETLNEAILWGEEIINTSSDTAT